MLGETDYTKMFKPFFYFLVPFILVSWISIGEMSKTNDDRVLLSVKVVPNFVTVEENQIAVFDCYYSCEVLKMHSHNAYWHVGDVERYRGFTYRTASLFTRKTGLHVETKDLSTCDENLSGTVRHQLKINASSSARWNATAVQCVALRTHVDQVDFYSHFALMIVTPRKNPVPEAPTTEITDGIEATTTTEVMDLTKTKEEKSTNSDEEVEALSLS